MSKKIVELLIATISVVLFHAVSDFSCAGFSGEQASIDGAFDSSLFYNDDFRRFGVVLDSGCPRNDHRADCDSGPIFDMDLDFQSFRTKYHSEKNLFLSQSPCTLLPCGPVFAPGEDETSWFWGGHLEFGATFNEYDQRSRWDGERPEFL